MQRARTTDKYRKVIKEKTLNEKTPENEVRISANTRNSRYITYISRKLLIDELELVTLKASGRAARDAVQVSEILRHNITNLHQRTVISTIEVVDEYEPLETGLETVKIRPGGMMYCLPEDVWNIAIRYMDGYSLLKIEKTCRGFYNMLNKGCQVCDHQLLELSPACISFWRKQYAL